MKRIQFYCIILILGVCFQTKAQVPFAQANQLPTLLNPSMAGNKEQKRIVIGANTFTANNETAGSNIAIGYDQMIQKIGCGVGIYYLQTSYKDWLITDDFYFLEDPKKKKYLTNEKQNTLGICIAPKYNIPFKDNPHKIKYTISPSVFIELGKSINSMAFNLRFENNFQTPPDDTVIAHYKTYSYNNSFLRYGMGVAINNNNILLLGKIAFSRNAYSENVSAVNNNISTQTENVYQSVDANSVLNTVEPSLNFGYSISKKTNPKLSFTPMVGIGLIHYFNLNAQYVQSGTDKSRYNLTQSDATKINYLHASINARYKSILFGAAYTKYKSAVYNGVTLGFQNNHVKLMCTMNFDFYKAYADFHKMEFTTGFFF